MPVSALLVLGFKEWVGENLTTATTKGKPQLLQIALRPLSEAIPLLLNTLSDPFTPSEIRCIDYLCREGWKKRKVKTLLPLLESLPRTLPIDAFYVWALLCENKWKKAAEILGNYSPEELTDEYSPLYVPMGCYLRHAKGEKIALSHFSTALELPHPPTPMLLGRFLQKKLSEKWDLAAFLWEKMELYRQLNLYYHCAGKPDQAKDFLKRFNKESKRVQTQHTYP